jgi:hypothetical protein
MKPAANRTTPLKVRKIERRDERRGRKLFDAYTHLPKDAPLLRN